MKNKHKSAEIIKKWADDTTVKIQIEVEGIFMDSCLHDVINFPNETFRIKPETIRYRVLLNKDGTTITADNECEEKAYYNTFDFSRWLTDWIDVER
jgi:hypothetical protein